MKQALLKLWEKYRGQMATEELNGILERGICYSEIKKAHRILVTGMNPSFRKDDPACNEKVVRFNYQDVVKGGEDHYFTSFDKLFPAEFRQEVAYLDLLNIRETEQNTTWKFIKDSKGLELFAENLRLTQLFIEQVVRPQLIMVKNKGAWGLWGKNATAEENIWMGYRFERVAGFDALPCGEVLRITSLIDHPDRVTYNDLKETNLRGTLVLFTQHFQYCKAEERPTPELIAELCKAI